MSGTAPIWEGRLRTGVMVFVCALGACVERQAGGFRDHAVLESAGPPLEVSARQAPTSDGRVAHELWVRARSGSEGWFERAGRELQLEADGRRVGLVGGAGGLVARWVGGPGTLTWVALDGSAGLRVELSDLDDAGTRAPRFEPIPPTGLVEEAVPVGVTP